MYGGESVRKVIGLEFREEGRRKEMKIEAGMAEMRKALAEFVQRSSLSAQGHGDFHAFAKVEALQRGLSRKMGKSSAEVAHNTAEITSQRRDGNVVAYVECRQLLRQAVAVVVRKNPLREILGKTLGEKLMAAQRLISVMEDGSGGTILKPTQ